MTGQEPGAKSDDARRGSNESVVSTLVENHRRFLAFLEKRTGDRALAEDLLQDAFVRGIDRAGTVRSDESVVAWFHRLLWNALVDHRRRSATAVRAAIELDPEDAPAGGGTELEREACRCVLGLAETLKPEYAAALRRVDVEGAAVQDYAAEAGITPNNASVRLFRAREALKQRVAATCRTCAEHGCLDCTCGVRRAGG